MKLTTSFNLLTPCLTERSHGPLIERRWYQLQMRKSISGLIGGNLIYELAHKFQSYFWNIRWFHQISQMWMSLLSQAGSQGASDPIFEQKMQVEHLNSKFICNQNKQVLWNSLNIWAQQAQGCLLLLMRSPQSLVLPGMFEWFFSHEIST